MRNKLGRFEKGHIPWTKGKKYSEWNKRPSTKEKVICSECQKEFYDFKCHINRKKFCYCSRECYSKGRSKRIKNGEIKIQLPHYQGKQHPSYKTGLWILYNKLRTNKINSKCQICGIEFKGRKMHIHHKDKNRKNNERENLMILCSKCHGIQHRELIKKINCNMCQKEFERWPCDIGKRNYCSRNCMFKHRKIINFKSLIGTK